MSPVSDACWSCLLREQHVTLGRMTHAHTTGFQKRPRNRGPKNGAQSVASVHNEWRSRKQGFSNMTRVFSYINNAIFDPTARHSMLSMGLLSCCLGERHRSRAPFFLPRGISRFYLSPSR